MQPHTQPRCAPAPRARGREAAGLAAHEPCEQQLPVGAILSAVQGCPGSRVLRAKILTVSTPIWASVHCERVRAPPVAPAEVFL
eukprot:5233301-Prymnesium_polylepis.1